MWPFKKKEIKTETKRVNVGKTVVTVLFEDGRIVVLEVYGDIDRDSDTKAANKMNEALSCPIVNKHGVQNIYSDTPKANKWHLGTIREVTFGPMEDYFVDVEV